MNRAPRQPKRNPLTAPIRRLRFAWVAIFFCTWVAVIGGRLVWLQVIRHSEWVEKAERQQHSTVTVAPQRGILYDRNLRELAMTVKMDSVYVDPSELGENRATTAEMLTKIVHTDPTDAFTSEPQMLARFNDSKHFAWVARRVDPATADRVRQLNLKGVYFYKEFKRFYPNNDLAAQVLGYVGTEDTGLGGLESQFDDDLHGTPGNMLVSMDAKRHAMDSVANDAMPGANLVLSIDANIQYMAERALDAQMAKMKALHGTVVVQDPHTGQILALAISPRFNPNDSRHMEPGSLTNLAVSDIYEPGSTFKLVTYAAALESRVTNPDDMIDCQGGSINLNGRIIHDNQGEHFGVIPVHKALEESSDVAAIKLALRVGPDRFYKFIRDFGFGARSGTELPGETRGLLQPVKRWSSNSIGSIAIGQEVAVTPIQLVAMVTAIANGGVYLPPHILMPGQSPTLAGGAAPQTLSVASPFKPGEELPNPLPDGAHRVISTLTAAQMRKMMEGVVLYGSGKEAQLNGYSSGGKTGTAQKIDPATHRYSKSMHVASFAGIAPVNNPVIAVAAVMDNPKGQIYGATVSAPVFAEVAQQVLEYLGVAHDIDLHTVRAAAKDAKRVVEDDAGEHMGDIDAIYNAANDLPNDDPLRGTGNQSATSSQPAKAATPSSVGKPGLAAAAQTGAKKDGKQPANAVAQGAAPGNPVVQASKGQATTAKVTVRDSIGDSLRDSKRLRVPSLIGLSVRKVIEQAAAAGLEVQISGSGTVREQAPAAGTMVSPGTQIVVRCGR